MLLSGIYYGRTPIVRAYKNGEIIWRIGDEIGVFVSNYIMSNGIAVITSAAMECLRAEYVIAFGEPVILNEVDSAIVSSLISWGSNTHNATISAIDSRVAKSVSDISTNTQSSGVAQSSAQVPINLYVFSGLRQDMNSQDSAPTLVLSQILTGNTQILQSSFSCGEGVSEAIEAISDSQVQSSDSLPADVRMELPLFLDLDLVSQPSSASKTRVGMELDINTEVNSPNSCTSDIEVVTDIAEVSFAQSADSVPGNIEVETNLTHQIISHAGQSSVGQISENIGIDDAFNAISSDTCRSTIDNVTLVDDITNVQSLNSIPGFIDMESHLIAQIVTHASQSTTSQIDSVIPMDDESNAASSDTCRYIVDNVMPFDDVIGAQSARSRSESVNKEICLLEQAIVNEGQSVGSQTDENILMAGELNTVSADTQRSVIKNVMLTDDEMGVESVHSHLGYAVDSIDMATNANVYTSLTAPSDIEDMEQVYVKVDGYSSASINSTVNQTMYYQFQPLGVGADTANQSIEHNITTQTDADVASSTSASTTFKDKIEFGDKLVEHVGDTSFTQVSQAVEYQADEVINVSDDKSVILDNFVVMCSQKEVTSQSASTQTNVIHSPIDMETTIIPCSSTSSEVSIRGEDGFELNTNFISADVNGYEADVVDVVDGQPNLLVADGFPTLLDEEIKLNGPSQASAGLSCQYIIDAQQHMWGELQQSLGVSKTAHLYEMLCSDGSKRVTIGELSDGLMQTTVNSYGVVIIDPHSPFYFGSDTIVLSEVQTFLQQLSSQELDGVLNILSKENTTLTVNKVLGGFVSDVCLQNENEILVVSSNFLRTLIDVVTQDSVVAYVVNSKMANIADIVRYAYSMTVKTSKFMEDQIMVEQWDTVSSIANLVQSICQTIANDATPITTNISFRCSARLSVVTKSDLEWEWPVQRDTDLFITQVYHVTKTDNGMQITLF